MHATSRCNLSSHNFLMALPAVDYDVGKLTKQSIKAGHKIDMP